MPDQPNLLYYGDNLNILRDHIEDETADLIYLDPPFKSDQNYNVLIREQDGTRSAANVHAFGDTWRWDQASEAAWQEAVDGGGRVANALQAYRKFLGPSDMLAYLSMMAPRLKELRRVLKRTGSIYVHCDPSASHYLKILMDSVFGPTNFRNEIIWKRTHAHGSSRRYGPIHDVILFYTNSDDYLWTDPRTKHSDAYIEQYFTHFDKGSDRPYQPITLTGSGIRHGESGRPWRGVEPTEDGRHWALPGEVIESLGIDPNLTVQEKLDALDDAGLIFWPEKEKGKPRLKWYADALLGMAINDIWADISPLSARAVERLGYPTQKPQALMERIINASSQEGQTVLDPFCGCGTTLAVAQKLNRRWIGIDAASLATSLIKNRLRDSFGQSLAYEIIGAPADLSCAASPSERGGS